MAEHAECCRNPAAAPASLDPEQVREWKGQLEASRLEIAALRHAIDGSVALKLARSLSWLLTPVRSLLPKPPAPPGQARDEASRSFPQQFALLERLGRGLPG